MEHTIWITFDEYTWIRLPHATYATAIDPLVGPGSRFSKTIANMASLSYINPTHTPHMLTPTQKLIDYSAIDSTSVNVTGFHKGTVLHLAQKSSITSITSLYDDIFVQGAQ